RVLGVPPLFPLFGVFTGKMAIAPWSPSRTLGGRYQCTRLFRVGKPLLVAYHNSHSSYHPYESHTPLGSHAVTTRSYPGRTVVLPGGPGLGPYIQGVDTPHTPLGTPKSPPEGGVGGYPWGGPKTPNFASRFLTPTSLNRKTEISNPPIYTGIK